MWGADDNNRRVCHRRCPTVNQLYMLSTAIYSEEHGDEEDEALGEWNSHGGLHNAEQSICKRQCDMQHGCLF